MREKYFVLLKYKDFMKTLYAGVINTFGDCFDALALSLLLYEITGSKYWFALNFAINSLPNLAIQPFMGAWIERLSKKWVMVIADCGRGILVLLLIAMYATKNLNPWVVLIFSFLMTTFEAFRIPAAMAVMPNLVEPDDYDVATSLKQSTSMLVQVVATALAGSVIAAFGISSALWIDAFSFGVSALLIASVSSDKLNARIGSNNSYWHDLKEGLSYFKNHSFLMQLALFGALISLLSVGFSVMIIPFLIESMHFDPQQIAIFNTVIMVAAVIGSLSYPIIHKTMSNHRIFAYGILIMGVFMGAGGVSPYLPFPLIIFVFAAGVGLGQGLFQSSLSVSFVSNVDKDQLSRAGALFNSFSYAASPLGSLLISLVITTMSIALSYVLYGILIVIIALFLVKDKRLKTMK